LTNIFDVQPDATIQTVDENVDYVTELVGEGKKFKDISGLARGKAEADLTIEVLKKKLDDLNKELTTRASLETFLDQMKAEKGAKDEPAQGTPQGGQREVVLDDSTLEAKLAALLEARESSKKAESNIERVTRVLQEQFGGNASQVIQHKAKEVGMAPKQLEALAKDAPEAFFRLVGVTETRSPQTPAVPASGLNTFGSDMKNVGIKNQSYYESLKRTNPKAYFDPKTTVEMIQQRTRLGQDYYK